MGEDDHSTPGRRPPSERRGRFGRGKEPVLGRKAKPSAGGASEGTGEPGAKPKPKPKPKPKAEARPKPEAKPKPESKPRSLSKQTPRSSSRPTPKPKPGPKPKADRKPKPRRPRDSRERPRRAAPTGPTQETRGEVIGRRISAVVILLVVAVAIMALTDAAPFFDDVTEEQRVEETVERFFAAYGERDFETVCGLFSAEVSEAIEQAGATETREAEVQGCSDVLAARFGADDGEATELEIKIESVRVSGPRAVADVIVKTEAAPKGRSVPVELESGPDGWLITRQVITG